jgi:hypothetical protein
MSSERPEREAGDQHAGEPERDEAERGAEAYGGDEDAEPSVTEGELDAGMERDQAEG